MGGSRAKKSGFEQTQFDHCNFVTLIWDPMNLLFAGFLTI